MRNVNEILAEARSHNLILAALFELRSHPANAHVSFKGTGTYQAAFFNAGGHYDSGRGGCITSALEDALERAKGLKGAENRPIPKPTGKLVEVEDLI